MTKKKDDFLGPINISSLHALYQPIIEIGSEDVIGYEALMRGSGMFASPQKMFQYSYAEGFTIPLDIECMKQAFHDLPKLKKNQLLFVNVEPATLNSCFLKGGKAYLLLSKLKRAKQVVFELTEGLKTWDLSLARVGVESMRKFGCRLALDDMKGIGSKLFEMLTLKPDFIKIDMSLIQGLVRSELQQSIVRQLVQLGRKHESEVIAEGVETESDLRLVQEMSIRFAQGYIYSKPKKLAH